MRAQRGTRSRRDRSRRLRRGIFAAAHDIPWPGRERHTLVPGRTPEQRNPDGASEPARRAKREPRDAVVDPLVVADARAVATAGAVTATGTVTTTGTVTDTGPVAERPSQRGDGRTQRDLAALVVLGVCAIGASAALMFPRHSVHPLATAAAVWVLIRLAIMWIYKPTRRPVPPGFARSVRAAALVPAYNEDPASVLATLRSLESQTRAPDRVFFIDDGSKDRSAVDAARDHARQSSLDIQVIALTENRGKRFAQDAAWARTRPGEFDVWLFIDSDTTLADDAIERMLETFADERIDAATSLILPRNRNSVFARLQETEYANGILFERALAGVLGAVPVMSGGFCAVRDAVVFWNRRRYLEGYWGQHISDDRHLAILAGATGRVVTQTAARSYTEAPTHWRPYLKQRIRWQRGAWIGQFWTIAHLPANRWMWWVVAGQIAVFPAALTLIVIALAVVPLSKVVALWAYVAVLVLARSLRYLAEPHPRPFVQYAAWLTTPFQQLVGLFVLTPLKVYALATCRRGSWGTR
ncbi:MAG TPA: glycosyltransferase family 2 protein [Euzebyales bacterium]